MLVPPDPIPNSEVKRPSADDSVGPPHVKVGHCQVFVRKPRILLNPGFFLAGYQVCSTRAARGGLRATLLSDASSEKPAMGPIWFFPDVEGKRNLDKYR